MIKLPTLQKVWAKARKVPPPCGNSSTTCLRVEGRQGYAFELAVVAGLACFSFVVFYLRGGLTSPVVDLTSDAANIATMAAALDFPEHFARDSQFRNFKPRFYVALHVPLTRLLFRITGDYGHAFTLLLFPTLFGYLLAFYLLGSILFASRWYGLALALANMVLIKGPRDTAWGPFKDALPRFTHAIAFAVVLALLWRWRNRPWFWPICFFIAGLGLYVHPVSTPALGLMLVGACIAMGVYQGNLRKCILPTFVGVLAFCAPVLPYALAFTQAQFSLHVTESPSLVEADEIANILETRFTGHYLSPTHTVLEYFSRKYMLLGFLPCLLVGLVFAHSRAHENTRAVGAMCVGLLVGLLVATVLTPVIFELLTPPWAATAFKGELPRALRFIVPITYIVALACCYDLQLRTTRRSRYVVYAAVGLAGLLAMVPLGPRAWRALENFGRERTGKRTAVIELVMAVRQACDRTERVCAVMEDPLVIRYSAIRSLAFAPKDIPDATSAARAREWVENMRHLRTIKETEDWFLMLSRALDWARKLEARYVVVEKGRRFPGMSGISPENLEATILFQNSEFVLLEVENVLPHTVQ